MSLKTIDYYLIDLDKEPDEIHAGRWVSYDALRAEAIKQVKNHKYRNELHCNGMIDYNDKHSLCERVGAIKELMEFFNLKDDDLK